MTDDWYFKWAEVTIVGGLTEKTDSDEFTGSWVRVPEQLKYIEDNGYVNGAVLNVNSVDEMKNVVKNDGIQVGDMMYFKDSKDGIHHSVMITTVNSDGTIKFSAHSNDRINQLLTDGFFTGNGGVAEQILVVRMK